MQDFCFFIGMLLGFVPEFQGQKVFKETKLPIVHIIGPGKPVCSQRTHFLLTKQNPLPYNEHRDGSLTVHRHVEAFSRVSIG